MKKLQIVIASVIGALLVLIGFVTGVYFSKDGPIPAVSPAIFEKGKVEKPLLEYTFPNLRTRNYQAQTIYIEKELFQTEEFTSYVFSYTTLGRKMSGQLTVPKTVTADTPVIVMLRGYVPLEIYTTGVGTKNAAAVFAKNGFITIAPDFFGYGESDPEPKDSWQARFEKPIVIIELIKTIREVGIPLNIESGEKYMTQKVGMWGHSNGGQIAMSTLVTMQESIPTTLWAPVLVPFPYSIMYFSDESEDEGRGMRIWVSQLEALYDLREFSFTQYLDGLVGPLQIQHGTNDEAAPHIWSDEFVLKLRGENKRRADILHKQSQTGTDSTTEAFTSSAQKLEAIKYTYHTYPGADHNLQPNINWDQAVQKDLEFFRRELQEK